MAAAVLHAPDGTVHRIEVREGESLMQAALRHGIEGIVAECGGECACATCHVYVDEGFVGRLPPRSATEDDLLGFVAAERRPTSRLSCQIRVCEAQDGIVVTIPDTQIF